MLSTMLLVGCSDPCSLQTAQKLMGDRFHTPIQLDAYPLITADTVLESEFTFTPDTYYVIHRINSLCDGCVEEFKAIAELMPNYRALDNVEFLFIAEGPFPYVIQDAMEAVNFEGQVLYADGKEPFKAKHGLPSDDKLYDTLLVDGQGRLLMVGSFFFKVEAEQFFISLIAEDCEG